VTICNLVPFDTYNNTLFESILLNNNISSKISALNKVNEMSELLKAHFLSNKHNNLTYAQLHGFSLDTLLLSCNFNGIKCSASDFYQFYDYSHGNCYVFNYNQTSIKKTSKKGPRFGLQMELFSGIPSNL
jgi:hypothetical protein